MTVNNLTQHIFIFHALYISHDDLILINKGSYSHGYRELGVMVRELRVLGVMCHATSLVA